MIAIDERPVYALKTAPAVPASHAEAIERARALAPRLRERLPETERLSHYFHTRLAQQFDAMIHIDETRALQPLESGSGWLEKEAPETFPSGV